MKRKKIEGEDGTWAPNQKTDVSDAWDFSVYPQFQTSGSPIFGSLIE